MAVPPDAVGFAQAVGLSAVGYGHDSRLMTDAQRDYYACLFRTPWKTKELEKTGRQIAEIVSQSWTPEATATLTSLADGADLMVAGFGFEQFSANVAEFYDIPLATLHFFPLRVNGKVLPWLPAPLARAVMRAYERLSWSGALKDMEDAQRAKLGLPKATEPWPPRIARRGSLEIQAYDDVAIPGLAAEWASWGNQRPFIGTLTLGSETESDKEVDEWIAAGSAPIFFGFGGVPVGTPAETIALISAVCQRLGQRGLVGAGASDFSGIAHGDHVKVVGEANYAKIFAASRAVVHHGGAGTIAACLRAGVPQVSLWTLPDQSLRTAMLKRLKVGTGRRFSATSERSLITDLRRVLSPDYLTRARALAGRMTTPAQSAAAAAELVENFARLDRVH
jgi:UDP:flavonoid glycosyltransferase YjiC (YdhE family)